MHVISISDAQKVRACRGATSLAPAECIAAVPFRMAAASAVRLCAAATSVGPAKCMASLNTLGGMVHSWGDDARIALCRGVRSADAAVSVASCAASAASILPASAAVLLCRDAPPCATTGGGRHARCTGTPLPVQCLHAVRVRGASDVVKASVCQGAGSVGPATCFQAMRATSQADAAVAPLLCRHALGESPARCYAALQRTVGSRSRSGGSDSLSRLQRARLCAAAEDDAPATCAHTLLQALQSRKRRPRASQRTRGAAHVVLRDADDVVDVCQAAVRAVRVSLRRLCCVWRATRGPVLT